MTVNEAGRIGGKKSRRTLTKEQAQAMVAAREEKRRFKATCCICGQPIDLTALHAFDRELGKPKHLECSQEEAMKEIVFLK